MEVFFGPSYLDHDDRRSLRRAIMHRLYVFRCIILLFRVRVCNNGEFTFGAWKAINHPCHLDIERFVNVEIG